MTMKKIAGINLESQESTEAFCKQLGIDTEVRPDKVYNQYPDKRQRKRHGRREVLRRVLLERIEEKHRRETERYNNAVQKQQGAVLAKATMIELANEVADCFSEHDRLDLVEKLKNVTTGTEDGEINKKALKIVNEIKANASTARKAVLTKLGVPPLTKKQAHEAVDLIGQLGKINESLIEQGQTANETAAGLTATANEIADAKPAEMKTVINEMPFLLRWWISDELETVSKAAKQFLNWRDKREVAVELLRSADLTWVQSNRRHLKRQRDEERARRYAERRNAMQSRANDENAKAEARRRFMAELATRACDEAVEDRKFTIMVGNLVKLEEYDGLGHIVKKEARKRMKKQKTEEAAKTKTKAEKQKKPERKATKK